MEYFDSVVYPAFCSGAIKSSGDSKFLIMDARVIPTDEDEYIFTGLMVKKTTLEVKSDLDELGQLIEKDDRYSTAPFSVFIIYLKNHRMLFIENQKGSPSLKSFNSLAKFLLDDYVRRQSVKLKENNLPGLPIPILSIIGIPRREKIEEILKSVDRINSLTLKFLPLNGDGDIDFGGMFNTMSKELRQAVGSKKGEVVLKSPQNIHGIANVLEQSQGTVDPVFRVTYPDKTKGTINNEVISESMQIDIKGDNASENVLDIASLGKKMKNVNYLSESNKRIYEKNKEKIIPFVKK